MLEFDPKAPSKSFKQLLAENPHHKGGLAQLALAEKEAQLRSSVASPQPSQQAMEIAAKMLASRAMREARKG